MPPRADRRLARLGFPAALERLYFQLLALSGGHLEAVAPSLGLTAEALRQQLGPLIARGVVRVDAGRVHVTTPAEAVAMLVREHAPAAVQAAQQLEMIAATVPYLASDRLVPDIGEAAPLDGEVVNGVDLLGFFEALIAQTRGDLLWLRPDQWRLPTEVRMADTVSRAIATGRRSRAIYPVESLREAPAMLIGRAQAGEQIRVVAELPTRLAVIGPAHAVIREAGGPDVHLVVRQPALVRSLVSLFELLWDLATPVPALDRGQARPDLRRLLLAQLAGGSKDEQIARSMGISLRTVRRRVAALIDELGVDTRFQAGAEAVRRGWL